MFSNSQIFKRSAVFQPIAMLMICALFTVLVSCEEEGPTINLTQPAIGLVDTTYMDPATVSAQDRGVLLEDFTGVRCPNCPSAQAQAKVIAAGSSRVVVVAIHPGLANLNILTAPRNGAKYDFRNFSGGKILENLVGIPPSLPYGDVNRKLFPGESERYVSYPKWSNYVNSELLLPTPVNIYLTTNLDPVSRELLIESKIQYTSTATDSGSHYLTVYITESNRVDLQDSAIFVDTFYVHDHFLDSVVTPYSGVQLSADKVQGRVYIKQFKLTLPSGWNAGHCEVVAFVHQDSGRRNVIHVVKKAL